MFGSLIIAAQLVLHPLPPVNETVTGGSCTNQVVTAITDQAVPTCTTVDSSYTSGLGTTAGNLSQFAATTSAQLAGVISNETGSGLLVFGSNPTLTQTPVAVGSLPACGAGTANQIAFVNDALTPALGVAVSAGGALTVGVICKNGTGWIVF